MILLAGAICAGSAYAVSTRLLKKEYTASASFEVNIPVAVQSGTNFNTPALVAADAQLPTSIPALQQAIADMRLERATTPAKLAERASCAASDVAQTFSCTLTYPDQNLAVRLLDDLGRLAVATNNRNQAAQLQPLLDRVKRKTTSLQRDLSLAQNQLASAQPGGGSYYVLTSRIDSDNTQLATLSRQQLQLEQSIAAQSASIIPLNPAYAPSTPSSPRPVLNTILAAVLGLLLATGVVLAADYFEDSPRSPEDLVQTLGASVFAALPRAPRGRGKPLEVIANQHSPGAEAYRMLRTSVQFANIDSPVHAILITSAVAAEGKTTVASNLALAFAQAGVRVVLVDADLRRPTVHTLFGLNNDVGLTHMLLMGGEGGTHAALQRTDEPNLLVLTSGPLPPNPSELLSSQRMRVLTQSLRRSADLLIFDSPPILAVTDPAILASMADAVLLVVDDEHARLHTLQRARQALESVGARISGVVRNRAREHRGGYYGYGAYYSASGGATQAAGGRGASVSASAHEGAAGVGE